MKMTKFQLRRLIREYMLNESLSQKERDRASAEYEKKKKMPMGPYGVNVSDVVRAKPVISEWADILIDELGDEIPQMLNVPPNKKKRVVGIIAEGVVSSLIKAMAFWAPHHKKF